MTVYSIETGMLGVNSYFLINDDTSECIIIDGGENYSKICETLNKLKVKPVALLLTHAHFDHSLNAKLIQQDGVKVYASVKESEKLRNGQTLGERFHKEQERFSPDYEFLNDETLEICGIKIKVILTPGHTDGSATFIVDDMMFTGDTLFFESIGRTDFPTGSMAEIRESIKKLYNFKGEYKVYPGHGEATTLSHERKFNPYIRND
ncbi:MAG: MBL fold metallo-hydrolase [Clostridia bacterium]|nr:MBL fold metallo-hydrolase [Clostridia bacterium]